ncbi:MULTISPECIES: hypothetical protein [unclassified Tolypothrix]|uniref:hypothetical protein n=1 Tax=unclassified Tolypothrix TaxID=2649714 RepID=UPI0005EABDA9|nr:MULTISPECIES: hypothetical protein [unclassified Tolypothrix]BAY93492.1 hypothetical protein NIES3275_55310 [Microchaete diplosiphon NIES-3275]EKE99441.1 hypothetical protein FDUTEX481_10017 [Tolypothrix sp. PCC 7601]MBE9080803.1 hypothetical protein [Tolypothrix sp. LEGE 11397]UYD27330.1 hypothetical protein HGR01_04320 [Tolypothrix sp. PCC 7712]UYD36808.1 hypothetical protein HG267_14410 [Tolypothrix sp. PCC 7601]
MSLDRHQQRYHALQKQYDLEAEKLKELRCSYAIEANVSVKFQLRHQIEKTETELQELEQQLEQLERASSTQRLYRALLKLGYRQQNRAFRRFVEAHSLGAFLIHGSQEYGQRWLLNRLIVQHVPSLMNAKEIPIKLSRIGRRSDIAALWRELGGKVGLGKESSKLEIAERVYQWWRTQDVLLIIHNVDCLSEDFLHEIIKDFWLPLTTKVREVDSQASQLKLFMFLVDYEGCTNTWNLDFAEKFDPNWNPNKPVKLPKIGKFSGDELTKWLEHEEDELPRQLTDQIDETVQTILNNSDKGLPQLALVEICYLSDCNWYKHEEKWLRL